MRVSVTVEAGKFTRILNLIQFQKLSKGDMLSTLGMKMAEMHARRVLAEKTSPDGDAWAPLKPATVRKKGNSNILVESGRMAKSWRVSTGGNAVRLSNGTPYLIYHQFGTSKMVQRKVMGLSERNLAEIEAAVKRFFASRIGAAAA